jgi:hypothetical protein
MRAVALVAADLDGQALTAMVIDSRQQSEPPPAGQILLTIVT